MHMSDALISPVVGGTMLLASAGAISYATKKVDYDFIEKRVPYVGVVGAFVFASQMINFAIPGTGSSGHIGGGLLLAILLGPYAGFLTMANVLLIQALFFADGGLLAFGCNLINLGFFTCFVTYPLVYKPISSKGMNNGIKNKKYVFIGATLASIIGLQLGSLGVVFETLLSGQVDISMSTFLLFMQPIHLAIGIVEGLLTGAVVSYLYEQKHDLHYDVYIDEGFYGNKTKTAKSKYAKVLILLMMVTLFVGGFLSNYASGHPDGLEWALENVEAELEEEPTVFTNIQETAAFLPDYGFKEAGEDAEIIGTTFSGIVGSLILLLVGTSLCFIIKLRRKKRMIIE